MEEFLLCVFRSRTQVLTFKKRLEAIGIPAEIVSTPREIAVGCGLSLKISAWSGNQAKELLRASGARSFVGFYRAVSDGYKNTVISMNF